MIRRVPNLGGGSNTTPYLRSLGRGPRILWHSDSMGGLLTRSMIISTISNSNPTVLPIGGEYVASAAAQMAVDFQYRCKPGNQLADSRISQWTSVRTVTSSTISPVTGQPMTLVSDDPNDNLALWGYRSTTISLPDSCITAGFVMSLIIEPYSSSNPPPRLEIYNGATLLYGGLLDPTLYVGVAPMRFLARVPPNSFTSGQSLDVYLWTHQTVKPLGTEVYKYYVSEIQVNEGVNPPAYAGQETTGTKQSVGSEVYMAAPEGLARKQFDLGVLCYSNEGGWSNKQMTFEAMCSAIDAMLCHVSRVLVLTPPPFNNSGAWASGSDDARDVPNDWWATCKRAAASRNVFFTDMRPTFLQYSPSDVMTDTIHPNAAGTQLFVDAIATVVNSAYDMVPNKVGAGACTRIGPASETGTWTDDLSAPGNIEFTFLPVGTAGTNMWCRKSTQAGATCRYEVDGEQIALLYVSGGTAGEVDVSVDGGAAYRISLPGGGGSGLCHTARIVDAAGPVRFPGKKHTVICTVVSGHVKICGVVAMGGAAGRTDEAVYAQGLILPKTSGFGIKVDESAPTYGWKDIIGQMVVDESGANAATLAAYRGGSVREYRFGTGDKIDLRFHIPHDYVPGSDIFIHVHWSHNGTAITGTGTFAGTIAHSYSKGHQQAAFSAEKTLTISNTNITTANTPQYRHRIEEVQLSASSPSASQLDSDDIEVDGVLLVNFTLDTIPTITGGTTAEPFIHFIDIHYQSTQLATKNKAPGFYA